MMNEVEMATTTTEPAPEKQTKTANPKRHDAECYEKRQALGQKTAVKKKDRLSTRVFRTTMQKSQSWKTRSFSKSARRRKSPHRSLPQKKSNPPKRKNA